MIRATSLLCLPLLAACASPAGHFPSLDIREGERVSGTIAAPAAPPLAPSPASAGDLASLAVTAQASHAAFSQAVPQARALVAAAQAGDGWSAAQVAIADLEARRSALMIALADLDRLLVDAATNGADSTAIAATHAEAAALAGEEDRVIGELLGALGGY